MLSGFKSAPKAIPVQSMVKPPVLVKVMVDTGAGEQREVLVPVSSASGENAEDLQHRFNIVCRQADMAMNGRAHTVLSAVRLGLERLSAHKQDFLSKLADEAPIRLLDGWFREGLNDHDVQGRIDAWAEQRRVDQARPARETGEGLDLDEINALIPRVGIFLPPSPEEEVEFVEEDPVPRSAAELGEVGEDRLLIEGSISPADDDDGPSGSDDDTEQVGPLPDHLLTIGNGALIDEPDETPAAAETGAVVANAFFTGDVAARLAQLASDDADEATEDSTENGSWIEANDSVDVFAQEDGDPGPGRDAFDQLFDHDDEDPGSSPGGASMSDASEVRDMASEGEIIPEAPVEIQFVNGPSIAPENEAELSAEGVSMSFWAERIATWNASEFETERFLAATVRDAAERDLPSAARLEKAIPMLSDVLGMSDEELLLAISKWLADTPMDEGLYFNGSSPFGRLFKFCSLDADLKAVDTFMVALSVMTLDAAVTAGLDIDRDRLVRKATVMFLRSYLARANAELEAYRRNRSTGGAHRCSQVWEEIIDLFSGAEGMTAEYAAASAVLDELARELADGTVREHGAESALANMARKVMATKLPADVGLSLDLLATVASTYEAVERTVVNDATMLGIEREESRLARFSDACVGVVQTIREMIADRIPLTFGKSVTKYPLPAGAGAGDDVARIVAAYKPSLLDGYIRATTGTAVDPLALLDKRTAELKTMTDEKELLSRQVMNLDVERLKGSLQGFGRVLEAFLQTPAGQDPQRFPLLRSYERHTGERCFIYETVAGRQTKRTLIIPIDGNGATYRLEVSNGSPSLVVEGSRMRTVDIKLVLKDVLDEAVASSFHDVKFLLVGGQVAADAGTLRADMLSDDDAWRLLDVSAPGPLYRGMILLPGDLKPESPALSLRSGASNLINQFLKR